jgi:hypothetical protein
MDNIKNFKYKLIKNFLLKEELEILKKYCSTKLDGIWENDNQSLLAPSWYKDSLMDSFLDLKIPKMEKRDWIKTF